MSDSIGLGFVERKTDELFAATDVAASWQESQSYTDLVLCFHVKCCFFLERLARLYEKPQTYKELAAIATGLIKNRLVKLENV